MKILVCGGRDFADRKPGDYSKKDKINEYNFVYNILYKIIEEFSENYNPDDNWLPTDITIISGKAKGVDSAASDFAIVNYCQLEEYPADWKTHGKAAGHIRNKQMLEEGKPDLVVAFPGNRGTAHMVRIAKEAGVKVIEIEYNKGV